jgi:translation initiation factor IF-1
MTKEGMIEFDGVITEVLPDARFRVKLDNDHETLAYTAGRMKKARIRVHGLGPTTQDKHRRR